MSKDAHFSRQHNARAAITPRSGAPPGREWPPIPWTSPPASEPGEPLAEEWDTYRREVGSWLAEGQSGRYVLIKREEVLGLYDTWQSAREEGLKRFLREPFFVHPIRAEEPYMRIRGLNAPCPG